jgi:prolyl oligopeptidase
MRVSLHMVFVSGLMVWASVSSAQDTGALARHGLSNPSARPTREVVSETLFGVPINDPYRWMEAPARQQEMVRWIRSVSAHTIAELAALPGHKRLSDRLQAISRASGSHSRLVVAGDRSFMLRLDPDANVPKLVVRAAEGERVLVDPASRQGPPRAINNYTPSPSGRLVAVHIAEGGGEVGSIRFLEVASGRFLPDELVPVWGEFQATWIDEATVLYTRMTGKPGSDPVQNNTVRIHRLGEPSSGDSVLLGPGRASQVVLAPVEVPWAAPSPISEWTLGGAGGARADARVLVARTADVRAGRPNWIAISGYDDQVSSADLRANTLFIITTKDAPNGVVKRIDLDSPSMGTAVTVLPAGPLVLSSIAATENGVYVLALEDGVSRLLYLADGRGTPRVIPLPLDGTIKDLTVATDGRRVTFGLVGWLFNRRYFVAEGGVARPLDVADETYQGASAFRVVREECSSPDGTRIPLTLVARRDMALDGRAPTILSAYGSYGIPLTPFYEASLLGWLEEGGVVAIAHVRGGGEKGRAWHEAGRSANKPNGHADFIACAERLIALGYTSRSRLGAMGFSAAGLLIGPAVLKRPDLFAAAVPRVAILNPTRLGVAENGPNQFAEMGDPTTEAGFKALYAQDAYLMLERAGDAPDLLLTIGLNDRRVEPWMSAKFAAQALERFSNRRVILVRTDPEAGHGVGSTRDQWLAEQADVYAFFLNRFGVPEFQSPPR